jgi:hypothetical protein
MTTLQRPSGAIALIIECHSDWSPCQKLQAKAKAADLNHQCPVRHDSSYGPATERAKARAQAAWTREFNRVRATGEVYSHPSLGTNPNNYPSGFEDDFTHPCMEDEMEDGQIPTDDDGIATWAADHRTECIAGGLTSGPMKMLDRSVNSTFGPTVSHAVKNNPQIDEVDTNGCD